MKYTLNSHRPRPAPLDYSADLNAEQRAVVESDPGPLLVLAGAGTGKTRTLTYRVARIIASGCPPERVMLVTFTNRAAREMVKRVEGLLQRSLRGCAAGTFHRVGHQILRRHGEACGLHPDFQIVDPEDARELINQSISEVNQVALGSKRMPAPKVMASMFGLANGTQQSLSETISSRFPRFRELSSSIEDIANRYQRLKQQLNVLDFDDLLSHWQRILSDPQFASVAEKIRRSFDHVFVDEYQDINRLQSLITDNMAYEHRSLSCVGDDAQSIYSFRGADFSQIYHFKDRHADAQLMRLTTNYRSSPEILELANASIKQNREQYPKKLVAAREPGEKPALIPLRDVYQQSELVAQRVLELHYEHNLPLRKMGVLYRNHAHSLELQVELTRRKIPFSIRSGLRFFEQAHIKDVIAYLRAQANPRDSLAWTRLLRLNPGIGQQIAQQTSERITSDPAQKPSQSIAGYLAENPERHKGRARTSLQSVEGIFEKLESPDYHSPNSAIKLVLEQSYDAYLERSFPNAEQRKEDLQNLAAFASRYQQVHEFLDELALLEGISAEQIHKGSAPEDKLVLTTIHQAKGLEWPICFLIWLGDGSFPSMMALKNRAELEEERRLFYVATTRAADELYMCYPTTQDQERGVKMVRPSRFITEINPTLYERWEIEESPR